MAEGEELPPVVASLQGDDASFLAMLERDVAAAEEFSAELRAALAEAVDFTGAGGESGIGAGLAESIDAGLEQVQGAAAETSAAIVEEFDQAAAASAEAWAEAMDAGAAEARGFFDAAFAELAQIADTQAQQVATVLTEAGQEGGAGLAAGVDEAVAGLQAQVAALTEQLRQAEYQVFNLKNELAFSHPPGDPWGSSAALTGQIEQATAATEAQAEATAALTEEEISFGQAFDEVYARVQAGQISAAQGMAILAGEELQATTVLSRSIAQLTGSWAQAQDSLANFGTSEAQLAVTTNLLADSEDALNVQSTMLLLAFQQLAAGADVSIDSLRDALAAFSEAEQAVAASAQAMVEAESQVNLALLQNETAFVDDAAAMRDLAAASELTGVEMSSLLAELEAGNYTVIAKAAADAKATLSSTQLAQAEQQLAAANLTLLGTFARLAEGEDVSAEAQAAALAGVKSAQSEVDGLTGALGRTGAAAEDAAGGMSVMSNVMYGPLSMALFAPMMLLPMLSGLFSSSAVSAAQFTQAVQQDSNAVGDNTAAVIQQTLAKSDLSGISRQLGLSQAQLIEYAAGEKDVQDQVTAAYNAKQLALSRTTDNEQVHSKAQLESASSAQIESQQLSAQKQALDEVTAAVQQAIAQDAANSAALLAAEQTTQIYTAAVNALGQAQLLQVQQTKMANQATAEFGNQILFAESSVSYMNAAMGAAVASTRESALTSAYASVALLGLGTSQSELNAQLSAGEAQYAQATQGAQAYNTVLASLNGTTNTLLGSEASFTTTLSGLTTAVKANGDSLDVDNTKGAANITTITGIATAAQAASVAVYQNDLATGNASRAYQDATNKLEQEKTAFEQAADKAGLNRTQVQQLANELFKLPPNIQVEVNADTQPAESNLAQLLERINTSSGTVTVYENSAGTVSSTQGQRGGGARASGGPVEQGRLYHINESGAEGFWVAPADGYVVPHEAMAALDTGGSALGPAVRGAAGGGGQPSVVVHVYLNGHEISAEVRAEVQQYANHNSFTGFESMRG